MKLIIAIVNDDDGTGVMEALTSSGYSVTKLFSTGGFLRAGNITLLTGVDDMKVDNVLEIIGKTCKSRKTESKKNTFTDFFGDVIVGGATVFVSDIERFEKVQ